MARFAFAVRPESLRTSSLRRRLSLLCEESRHPPEAHRHVAPFCRCAYSPLEEVAPEIASSSEVSPIHIILVRSTHKDGTIREVATHLRGSKEAATTIVASATAAQQPA